jgi:hypothetical protein
LLPPKAELETKAVLRKAIAANKALAELNGAGELIPNQGILINGIVLQEAKLSSEIENVVHGTRTEAGQGIGSPNERIVRICRKKPDFWTYPRNISNTWTYRLVAVGVFVLAQYWYCAILTRVALRIK